MTTTTTTEKAVNYTAEQETAMKNAYLDGKAKGVDNKTIAADLAVMLNKSARSIVAKLTRMGVYKKDAYVTKTGEPVLKKDDAADAIGRILKLSPEESDSLAKANKSALKKVLKALSESKPIDGTETEKAMESLNGWDAIEGEESGE